MNLILPDALGRNYYHSVIDGNVLGISTDFPMFNEEYIRKRMRVHGIDELTATFLNDVSRTFNFWIGNGCCVIDIDILPLLNKVDRTGANMFSYFKNVWIPEELRWMAELPEISYNGRKGYFFSFEGVDGSGKSTVIKLVSSILIDRGYVVTATREPGGSPLAEDIRKTIIENEMSLESETLLFFAARHDHYHKTIAPAVALKEIVLCDRYIDSSIIYQGVLRGGNRVVEQLDTIIMNSIRPTKTFLIEVDLETAKERRSSRGVEDRFDSMDEERFVTMQQGFRELAKKDPDRFITIDNNSNAAIVAEKIADEIIKHLPTI